MTITQTRHESFAGVPHYPKQCRAVVVRHGRWPAMDIQTLFDMVLFLVHSGSCLWLNIRYEAA